ncbi:nicotinate (nicotinamide) nucleotide adenylyltransferase, partial [human gut metagenome]
MQMKICIYGGSFNPPHLGHTAALRAVRAAIRPDLLLVIPDRIPPHKELTAGSPEPAERLLMTMMAFADEPGVEVSDMELHRSGKS